MRLKASSANGLGINVFSKIMENGIPGFFWCRNNEISVLGQAEAGG